GSVGKEGAPNVIFIDANTLGELSTQSYREKSAAGRFLDWQLPLHSGRILGLPGRFIVFLGGLLPLALFVTGLFIWQRKRVALTSARR
ncbi:MAG: PepSY domain-containing protein, partial [Betaproteobacteria bacterium]|nr:PepSY domain-containing protein [Betaproteobacteria bacterium]